jgi:hypothetical protein
MAGQIQSDHAVILLEQRYLVALRGFITGPAMDWLEGAFKRNPEIAGLLSNGRALSEKPVPRPTEIQLADSR